MSAMLLLCMTTSRSLHLDKRSDVCPTSDLPSAEENFRLLSWEPSQNPVSKVSHDDCRGVACCVYLNTSPLALTRFFTFVPTASLTYFYISSSLSYVLSPHLLYPFLFYDIFLPTSVFHFLVYCCILSIVPVPFFAARSFYSSVGFTLDFICYLCIRRYISLSINLLS